MMNNISPLDEYQYQLIINKNNDEEVFCYFIKYIFIYRDVLLKQIKQLSKDINSDDFIESLLKCHELIENRLGLDHELYKNMNNSSLIYYYTSSWNNANPMFILNSISNSLYRLISVSIIGYVNLFSKVININIKEVYPEIISTLTSITNIITSTQSYTQNKTGY